MPWFRKRDGNKPTPDEVRLSQSLQATFRQYSPETDAQMQKDREALDRGDIPEGAQTRIRRTMAKELPWMSTLDIPDLYLADEVHMTPLVQVTGSSVFRAASDMNGRIYLDSNYDAANLVYAYYRAKNDAVDRLLKEAAMAGAHAVVDATFRFARWDANAIECTVIGTAAAFHGLRPPRRALVSPLSGEEFYKLMQRGWIPVNYCLGYHWHCMPVGYRTRGMASSWNYQNQELTSVTERFSQTRRSAIQKMVSDAKGGPRVDGFVGVKIDTKMEETELRIYGGYRGGLGFGYMGNGVTIDGSFYPYGPEGVADVPAYNLEFFATGAGVARIATQSLGRSDIARYLSALD